MVEIISFFQNLNINEIFATIVSTFAGAWLAYKWTEKTQQGIEKRAKQVEEQKDKENKTWQLNYLNIFLYMHLTAFIELFEHIIYRQKMIAKLQNSSAVQGEHLIVLQPLADFYIDFPLETHNLLFAVDDNHFIQGLSLVKTSLANYYNSLQMLNVNLKPLQTLLVSNNKLTKEHLVALQQITQYVLEEVSMAICVFEQMLKDIVKYNTTHDKLSLNPVKDFNAEQKIIILSAHQIRRNCVQKLQKQKYN